jgi:nanoRNase/pAp phosphatase (c-di-AMP/oligoRNAs hydrolase)
VALGGEVGIAAGWGECLAVLVGPDLGALRSQLGNELAARSQECGLRAMAVVAYHEEAVGAGRVKLSLRSIGAGEDTTAVSGALGGGGHLNASSCIVAAEAFEAWRRC